MSLVVKAVRKTLRKSNSRKRSNKSVYKDKDKKEKDLASYLFSITIAKRKIH